MAPKMSALMLAWLVLLLWVNFSESLQSSSLMLNRVKKDKDLVSKLKTERALNIAKESLSLLTDIVKDTDTKMLKDVLKAISEIAKLAPKYGAVISCAINVLLIFIPEEDPIMKEIKKGFTEVNRKLDSISIQISNLEADVEWFNYVSVYSRDERTILNAWRKYLEFQVSESLRTEEENIRLAELYIRSYEYSGVESSVSNLYHYLTVRSTSLSENINNLLRDKFRCDINQIGRYNIYLSSLLWKGMILKQFYWTLIDLNSAAKEAEHVKMFKEVSEAQLSAIEFCLNNYSQYMKKDVEEIAKQFSSDQKGHIAVQVKKVLDVKYNWYNWVVVVFDESQKKNHMLFTEFKFTIGSNIVAVDYTVKSDMIHEEQVKDTANICFKDKTCEIKITMQTCQVPWTIRRDTFTIPLGKYALVTQVAYNKDFAEVPAPFHKTQCYWGHSSSVISVHYSRYIDVCTINKCNNNGRCKELLRSNEWLCECQDGYYGDTCEKKLDDTLTQELKLAFPLPANIKFSSAKSQSEFVKDILLKVGTPLVACVLIGCFIFALIILKKPSNHRSCCKSEAVATDSNVVANIRNQHVETVTEMHHFQVKREIRPQENSLRVIQNSIGSINLKPLLVNVVADYS